MSVFGAFAEDFLRIGASAGIREGETILADTAARDAEAVAVSAAQRQGVSTLERLGVNRVVQTTKETLAGVPGRFGNFAVNATDKLVTPSRIVAVGAGGAAILGGFGLKNYLQGISNVDLGLGGLSVQSGGAAIPDFGGNPSAGQPNGGGDSSMFSPTNVAIGGGVAILLILGLAFLATRKKK